MRYLARDLMAHVGFRRTWAIKRNEHHEVQKHRRLCHGMLAGIQSGPKNRIITLCYNWISVLLICFFYLIRSFFIFFICFELKLSSTICRNLAKLWWPLKLWLTIVLGCWMFNCRWNVCLIGYDCNQSTSDCVSITWNSFINIALNMIVICHSKRSRAWSKLCVMELLMTIYFSLFKIIFH